MLCFTYVLIFILVHHLYSFFISLTYNPVPQPLTPQLGELWVFGFIPHYKFVAFLKLFFCVVKRVWSLETIEIFKSLHFYLRLYIFFMPRRVEEPLWLAESTEVLLDREPVPERVLKGGTVYQILSLGYYHFVVVVVRKRMFRLNALSGC